MTKPVEPHQINLNHQKQIEAALIKSAIIERWAIARRNIGIGATVCGMLLFTIWAFMYASVLPSPIFVAIVGLTFFVFTIAIGVVLILHQQSYLARRATLEDSLRSDTIGAVNDALGQLLRDTVGDLSEHEETITYGERIVAGVEVLTDRRAGLQRRITSLYSEMGLQEAIRAMVTEAMELKPVRQNIEPVTRFMEVHSAPLEPIDQKRSEAVHAAE